MRHPLRWVLLSLLVGSSASAVDWTPTNTLGGSGKTATWTSTAAGEDSGVLICQGECVCDNTHATSNFTVYRATLAGAQLTGDYWKGVAAANCSDVTLDHCLTVTLGPGTYIFDPDAAAVNTAQCRGRVEGQ